MNKFTKSVLLSRLADRMNGIGDAGTQGILNDFTPPNRTGAVSVTMIGHSAVDNEENPIEPILRVRDEFDKVIAEFILVERKVK